MHLANSPNSLTTAQYVLVNLNQRYSSFFVSAAGVVATILVIICLLWGGVVDQIGFHPGGRALNLVDLPVALGLYGFGYSGHSVFPNIYSSMKRPSQFPTVLIIWYSNRNHYHSQISLFYEECAYIFKLSLQNYMFIFEAVITSEIIPFFH